MNEELKKNMKEYSEKMTKFLDSCTNCSKTQLIGLLEREMNENHYLRNEVGKLNNIIDELENMLENEIEYMEHMNCEVRDDNMYKMMNLIKEYKRKGE